ncbi:MAG: 2-oxoacid:ferredoxin oxidoreductase subunit beta, partial [Deltaproteobacteria bacterium]
IQSKEEISVEMKDGEKREIELHDGSRLMLRKLDRDYDPTNKIAAMAAISESRDKQELITGLLYYNDKGTDLNTLLNTVDSPLWSLNEKDLDPGAEVLKKINASLR